MAEVREAAGRLTQIMSSNGLTNYFGRTFDGMGRVKQDEWFGSRVVKTYLYDAAGQLTNWSVTANSWSQNRSLRYDAGGRIVTQKVGSTVNRYDYDLTDQLTNSAGSFTYSATYDAVGNRRTADGRTYTPDNLNQYTGLTSPSQSLGYDDNGNLTNWNGASFEHDSQGQLTSSSALTGAWKKYDYRRLRVEDGYNDLYPENYHYTYDARGNLLERWLDYEGGQEYAYADGVDRAVLMYYDGMYSGTQRPYALVTDHLGSVIAIFDDSGHVVETYQYTPFGKTTIKDSSVNTISSSTVGNVLGFTGRERDGDYYYFRNRWYSPDLGRFLEPDPIGLAGWDLNLYRYVQGNPTGATDPDGLSLVLLGFVAAVVTIVTIAWFVRKAILNSKKQISMAEEEEAAMKKGDYEKAEMLDLKVEEMMLKDSAELIKDASTIAYAPDAFAPPEIPGMVDSVTIISGILDGAKAVTDDRSTCKT